jgi:hypothetical protein
LEKKAEQKSERDWPSELRLYPVSKVLSEKRQKLIEDENKKIMKKRKKILDDLKKEKQQAEGL